MNDNAENAVALCQKLTQKLTKSLTLNFWRVWCKTSNPQVVHSVSFGDQTSQDNGSASPTTDGNFHSECVSRFSRALKLWFPLRGSK